MFTWPIVTAEDEAAVLDVLHRGAMSALDVTPRVRDRVRRLAGLPLRPGPLQRHHRPAGGDVRLPGGRGRRDHLPQHHLLGLRPPRLRPRGHHRLRRRRPPHPLPRPGRHRAPHHRPHPGHRRRALPRPPGGHGPHHGDRPPARGEGDRGRLPRPRRAVPGAPRGHHRGRRRRLVDDPQGPARRRGGHADHGQPGDLRAGHRPSATTSASAPPPPPCPSRRRTCAPSPGSPWGASRTACTR